MIKVDNKKAISNLTKKYLRKNSRRNLIIILGIILTSLLITSVFTVTGILKESIESNNFRQVGTKFHGSFQYISEEEVDRIKSDPMIKSYGIRKYFGFAINPEFTKSQVEVSYMDEFSVENSFLTPEVGRLPKEGTKEIACDDEILELLGIEKNIGEEVSLEMMLGNNKIVSDTFILVGWWTYDTAMFANQALVPKSYIEENLVGYKNDLYDNTGKYNLSVYLDNPKDIGYKMESIATKYGYQTEDRQQKDYIDTGINWGYIDSQFREKGNLGVIVAIGFFVIIIGLSGYLIIYNIFQISVLQDIQFYGLLKTIGTTSKQIKKIIYSQALILSSIGIPIGIVSGLIFGNFLSTKIIGILNNIKIIHGINPIAVLISLIFSLLIVLFSARKPGKLAGKVSPIEAVKYVENSEGINKKSKTTKNKNTFTMAWANLGRSKKKTVISALSIALAMVLFQGSLNVVGGINEEKYLEQFLVTDFILGNAKYFNTSIMVSDSERTITDGEIENLVEKIQVKESGRVYKDNRGRITLTQEEFIQHNGWVDESQMSAYETTEDGNILDWITLYGLNDFLLDKLKVFEGSLEDVKSSENGIIAIYESDDYGEPKLDSNLKKLGDVVEITNGSEEKKEYKVLAMATIKYPMSVRYSGPLAFVVKEDDINKSSDSVGTMAYLFNVNEEYREKTGGFIKKYTAIANPSLDYESKELLLDKFSGLKNTIGVVGISFSLILAIIGILNFFNSIITGIISRSREFAILKAIGMTDRQIKSMLVIESLVYSIVSGFIGILITLILNKYAWPSVEQTLWFFEGKDSYLALITIMVIFIVLGIGISIMGNKMTNKKTIVERLF